MKPHKHAELIKAWADGAEIERFDVDVKRWVDTGCPLWTEKAEYRIKPEPKPDVVNYLSLSDVLGWVELTSNTNINFEIERIKLIRDGKTGKVKSAEVLK